jgi:hypothetical protein
MRKTTTPVLIIELGVARPFSRRSVPTQSKLEGLGHELKSSRFPPISMLRHRLHEIRTVEISIPDSSPPRRNSNQRTGNGLVLDRICIAFSVYSLAFHAAQCRSSFGSCFVNLDDQYHPEAPIRFQLPPCPPFLLISTGNLPSLRPETDRHQVESPESPNCAQKAFQRGSLLTASKYLTPAIARSPGSRWRRALSIHSKVSSASASVPYTVAS